MRGRAQLEGGVREEADVAAAVVALRAQLRAVLGGVQVALVHAVRVRALHALQHADEYICIAAALGIARKPCDGVEVMHITVALHNKTQTCVYACSRTVPKESLMRMQPYMLGMNVNDHHLQHASLALCITG